MDDQQRERLGLLLEQALSVPLGERDRFLSEACGADTALRDELMSLLAASPSADEFLARVAEHVVAPAITAASDSRSGGIESSAVRGAPAGASLAPGEIVAHYRIVERVGGGMGVVYRALDQKLGRAVALKFLPSALAADPRARRRLHAEARAASALDHPNIGVVHEIGEADPGGLYLALAWYEGETLRQRLERGPLPIAEAIIVARQVAAALGAAHDAGIIHRDVKPANIMCTPGGVVRLVDFGIAKLAGEELTRDDATPGTIAYMSPEQTRGAALDQRTDLWSLGVVLYEMLAGRRPFRGESEGTLIHSIRHDEPEPLDLLRPDSGALSAIVASCLAKVPDDRPSTAAALIAALDAVDTAASRSDAVLPSRSTTSAKHRAPHGVKLRRSRLTRAAVLLAATAILASVGFALLSGRQPADAGSSIPAGALSNRTALAVLPFENRSGSPEDEYFTDGLHEEIRSRLSALATLRVSPRTAVMSYRGSSGDVRTIAGDLAVDAVLAGGVLRTGDEVRVSVRLIDARTDSEIWSAHYDRRLDAAALFDIQREIAERVAEALHAEMSSAERVRIARVSTTDLEAYRHYLLGRHHWNRRDERGMDSAVAHFGAALDRDPRYARAYAGLADVHVLGYGPAGDRGYPLAISAARSALRLDPELAEAHASLGMALMYHEWDWAGAERAFRRALELDPGYATAHQWYAELLASTGRFEEALEHGRMAESLDPLSMIIGWEVARVYSMARRYDEAVEQLVTLRRVHPGNLLVSTFLALHLAMVGRIAESSDILEEIIDAREAQGVDGARVARLRARVAAARAGRLQELAPLYVELQEDGGRDRAHLRVFLATARAADGDMDGGLRILEELHRDRAIGLMTADLAVGAMFDVFRDEPRFQRLLRDMGIDPRIGLELRARDPLWAALR